MPCFSLLHFKRLAWQRFINQKPFYFFYHSVVQEEAFLILTGLSYCFGKQFKNFTGTVCEWRSHSSLNYAMCNKNSSIVIGSRLFRGFLGSYLSPISFRFAIQNLPASVKTLPPLDLATGHRKVRFCVLSHILVKQTLMFQGKRCAIVILNHWNIFSFEIF